MDNKTDNMTDNITDNITENKTENKINIAKIMIPKICTVFLSESNTVRQGYEKMSHHGYTALPVLDENENYIGSVTEGDFLRCILKIQSIDTQKTEKIRIREILRKDFCPALRIDADKNDVIDAVLRQNFVPIVDDRGFLCGIVTRRGAISYLAKKDAESSGDK